ncbi:MAG: manganese efflux pump MntP family protein [Clostridiaceae bacterium]
MDILSLFLIAVALSLDALGVSLCIGLNNQIDNKNKAKFALSFGFFQFLFSLAGAYAGFMFNLYIVSVPKIIGGLIITIVGIIMFREGMKNQGECILVKKGMHFILGISVSIDAMVVGFTALNNINSNILIFEQTLFIGFITLIISSIGFYITKYLRKIEFIGKYADYLGGIILILFGLKMIFI